MADWVTRYVLSNDAPAVTSYCPRVAAGPTDRLLGILMHFPNDDDISCLENEH